MQPVLVRLEEFMNMPSDAKVQYSMTAIKHMENVLKEPDPKVSEAIFTDFYTIVSLTFKEVKDVHDCLKVLTGVLVNCQELNYNPPFELLTDVFEALFERARNDSAYWGAFLHTTNFFKNAKFCRQFHRENEFCKQLRTCNKEKKMKLFEKFFESLARNEVASKVFFEEAKECPKWSENLRQMFFCAAESEMTDDETKVIVGLLFRLTDVILKESANADVTNALKKSIEENKLFEAINVHLFRLDASEVLLLYRNGELGCVNDVISALAFRGIADVFRRPECSLANKKQYMQFLFKTISELYARKPLFCASEDQFSLMDWFCNDICENNELWAQYAPVILWCIEVPKGPNRSVRKVMDRIADFLIPPRTGSPEKLEVAKQILQFVTQVLKPDKIKISRHDFGDDILVQKLFVTPPVEEVIKAFQAEPRVMKELFTRLLLNERWQKHNAAIMERIIQMRAGPDRDISDFVTKLVSENYSPGMLRFFMGNLHREDVATLFVNTNAHHDEYDFVGMFKKGDCFSALETILPEMTEFQLLFDFISKIIGKTNSRFFDDWILSLPKDSKIFTLGQAQIAMFVCPPGVVPLRIPSLLCLCGGYETSDPYELYLISKYSLPVLLKLGKPLSELLSFNDAIFQFVEPATFFEIFRENQHVEGLHQQLKSLAMRESQGRAEPAATMHNSLQRSVYEFFKADTKSTSGPGAYLKIVTSGINQICFSVKIDDWDRSTYPLLCFNGTSLDLREKSLCYGERSLTEIVTGKWVEIQLTKNSSSDKGEVVVDGEKVGHIKCGSELNLQSIGTEKKGPPVRFFVSCDVTYTDADKSKKYVEVVPYGRGIVCVPYYSISDAFEQRECVAKLFSIFDCAVGGKRDEPGAAAFLNVLVSVLWKIQSCVGVPAGEFLSRFLYSLKMSKTVQPGWLETAFCELLVSSDVTKRTQYFVQLFFDTEIWSTPETFHSSVLSQFVKTVHGRLDKADELLDLDYLCTERNCFLYIMQLLQYFKDDASMKRSLKDFLFLFTTGVKRKECFTVMRHITGFSQMWDFTHGDEIKDHLLMCTKSSDVQAILVEFLMDVDRKRKTKLVSRDDLLIFSLILPVGSGWKCWKELLDKLSGESMDLRTVMMICEAGKRYAFEKELPDKLKSVLEKTEPSDETKRKDRKKPDGIVALIFELLIPILSKPDRFPRGLSDWTKDQRLHDLILKTVMSCDIDTILRDNGPVKWAVMDFLSMGIRDLPTPMVTTQTMKEIDEIVTQKVDGVVWFQASDPKLKKLEQKVQTSDKDFAKELGAVLKAWGVNPPFCGSLMEFVAMVMGEILCSKAHAPEKLKGALELIVQYAHPEICSVVLTEVCRRVRQFGKAEKAEKAKKGKELSEKSKKKYVGIVFEAFRNAGLRPGVLKSSPLFKEMFELATQQPRQLRVFAGKEFMDTFIAFHSELPPESLPCLVEFLGSDQGWTAQELSEIKEHLLYVLCIVCQQCLPETCPNIQRVFEILTRIIMDSKYKQKPLASKFVGKNYALFIKDCAPEMQDLVAPLDADMKAFVSKKKPSGRSQSISEDLQKIVDFVFKYASVSAIRCLRASHLFFERANIEIRKLEKQFCPYLMMARRHGISVAIQNHKVMSYRRSPFSLPLVCPTLVLPSESQIYQPNEIPPPVDVRRWCNLAGQHVTVPFECPTVTDDMPQCLFRYSSCFVPQKASLSGKQDPTNSKLRRKKKAFAQEQCEQILNCHFVRAGFSAPCVLAVQRSPMLLIMLATWNREKGVVEYVKEAQPWCDRYVIESALAGEFGSFFMLCGHIAVELKPEEILLSQRYNYAAKSTCLYIYSLRAGSFILEFDEEPPEITGIYSEWPTRVPIKSITERWQSTNQLSNLEYLNRVNFEGGRRFVNFSAYPIFPKIMMSIAQKSLTNNMRDLSVTLEVASDQDPTHKDLKDRFESMKYHHQENFSHPMLVSLLLFRLVPCCQCQWSLQGGWDAGCRYFLSIPEHISVHRKMAFEIMPEFFCFPEAFLNLNKFHPPNTSIGDCELPQWSRDIYRFIETHRDFLESNTVRSEISGWIDLCFGTKILGEAADQAMNKFCYLYYINEKDPPEKVAEKHNCMAKCGCVPRQVFTEPHPRPKLLEPSTGPISVDLKPYVSSHVLASGYKMTIIPDRAMVSMQGSKMSIERVLPEWRFVTDFVVGRNRLMALATDSISRVRAFWLLPAKDDKPEQWLPIQKMIFSRPKFSAICEDQMMAVTVCMDEVVFWSIANGWIVTTIPERKVVDMCIDDGCGVVFLAFGNTVGQYTINGNQVRQIVFEEPVSAVTVLPRGHTIFDKVLCVGFRSGWVRLCQVDRESGEFKVFQEQEVSDYPITRLRVVTSVAVDGLYYAVDASDVNTADIRW